MRKPNGWKKRWADAKAAGPEAVAELSAELRFVMASAERRRQEEAHHEELHRIGQRSFQARHQVDLEVVAGRYSEEVKRHEHTDWSIQDPKTGAVTCGVCGVPCDGPVGP